MFQLTAARRRLAIEHQRSTPPREFQLTAARRRLASGHRTYTTRLQVSTPSRPKAAGNANHGNTEREARFNSQPPEGGWISIYFMLHLNLPSFNSQPPEGGWWLIVIDRDVPKLFQLTAARRRLEKV